MKRAYLIIMASGLLSLIEPLHAQQIVEGVALDSLRLKRNGDNLSVEMDVDLGVGLTASVASIAGHCLAALATWRATVPCCSRPA